MNTLFREHLHSVMPAEQLDVAQGVIALLEQTGMTAPFEPLQEIMEVSTSNIDSTTFVAQITDVLDDALDALLLAFGIVAQVDATMAFKLALGKTVAELETYYLPSEVLDILSSAYTADVSFAEIVHLTQGLSVEEVLDHLSSVSDALISRIHEVLQQSAQHQAVAQLDDPLKYNRKQVTVINRLLSEKRPGFVFGCMQGLVWAGAKHGLPFEALLNQYAETLVPLSAAQLTSEITGLVVYSDTPQEEWARVIQETAEGFTDLVSDHRQIGVTLQLLQPYLI